MSAAIVWRIPQQCNFDATSHFDGLHRVPMYSENELPLSLRRKMNSVDSVTTLNTYRLGEGKDVLKGAINVDAQYDKQSAQFVSRLENVELQVIIENYREFNRGDDFWEQFHPDTCTWSHVHDELKKVEAEYIRKGSVLRRVLRDDGFTRNLTPLLEGIPDSDGLGFLKGGFIILFNAIRRRAQAVSNIFACFRQVPDILREAHEALRRFPDSRSLYECSCRLHEELFSCLPRLIAVLLRKSDQHRIKRFAKALFGDEVTDVNRVLQSVTSAQKALKSQINRLNDQRNDATAKDITQLQAEMRMFRKTQHDQHQDHIGLVNERDNMFNNMFSSFCEAQKAQIESLHAENSALRLYVSNQHVLNPLHQIFAEISRNRDYNVHSEHIDDSQTDESAEKNIPDILLVLHQQNNVPKLLQILPPQVPVVQDLDELLTILCADTEGSCHVDDLYATLRTYDTFSDKDLAESAYLAETQAFRQWLQRSRTGPLLVDGHCGNHMHRRTSPMSVFCASLIQSLLNNSSQQQEQESRHQSQGSTDLVLYFFCGRHMYDEGLLAGPQGLIRSLAAQLILAWPQLTQAPDLEFLSSLFPERIASAQADLDIETVCEIFEALLEQLPTMSTVHCVIDGLSCFETSIGNWSEEIWAVVDFLSSCCSYKMRDGPRPTLKLLLANADKSTVVCDLPVFQMNGIVDLRAGSFYGSSMTPTALISDLQSQKSLPDVVADEQSEEEDIMTLDEA